jgi:hypothetical protein
VSFTRGSCSWSDGDLLRDEQEAVIRRIVVAIEGEYAEARDMVNRTVRVSRAGKPTFDE